MKPSNRGRGIKTPYLLLAPFFIPYLLFWVGPLIKGFLLSLESDTLYGESTFVGFDHYLDLFYDNRFLHSLYNTFIHALTSILVIIPFSLLVSVLLLNTFRRFRGFFRFIIMVPGLTAPSVLALLFLLVFNGPYGLINQAFLVPLGFPNIDWIRDPNFIKPAILIQGLWRWTGFITIFLIAGLDGIPKTYYDAAKIDGAGRVTTFFRITIPLLKNVLLFLSIFMLLDAFVLFAGAYVLLGGSGSTGDTGLMLISYTYQTAYSFGKFGSAAAMSFSLVPFLMIILWVILKKGAQPDPEGKQR